MKNYFYLLLVNSNNNLSYHTHFNTVFVWACAYCSNRLPKAVSIITAVQGNGMAQTNINMLNVNKQGFRSLNSEAMKKLMGGVGVSVGCPTGACVFRGSYCQIVTGTCSGTDGDCRCTGGSGSKVESSAGCSATLNGPGGFSPVCYEDANNVSVEF